MMINIIIIVIINIVFYYCFHLVAEQIVKEGGKGSVGALARLA